MKYLCMATLLLFGCGSGGGGTPDADLPVPPPPQGATWFVETESGSWVDPPDAERFLSLAPEGFALWLHAARVTQTDLDFMLAVGGSEAQDLCTRTIAMERLTLSPTGRFRFGPADFVLPNGLATEDLVLEGRFSADGSQIMELDAEGLIDLASIPEDLVPMLDEDDRCAVVSALLEVECVACRDGREICLHAEMEGFLGVMRPLNSAEEVLLPDCHPGCEASEENPECDTSGW